MPPFTTGKACFDAEVHLQIAVMSRNKVLLKQLRQIFEHIYLRYRVERMHPVRLTISSEEHKELDEMIRNKEREGAERMIRLHIRTAKEMNDLGHDERRGNTAIEYARGVGHKDEVKLSLLQRWR